MTREELKEHCQRQIDSYNCFCKIHAVALNDIKRFEEHNLILEIIEKLEEIEQRDDLVSKNAVRDCIVRFAQNSRENCTGLLHEINELTTSKI